MFDNVAHLIALSGGLLAIMPLLLIATLAIGIERWWLLSRTVRSGRRLQAIVYQIGYRDLAPLRSLAGEHAHSLVGHLVATAISSRGDTADAIETHLDEEIMRSTPRLTRGLWVLDTAVTIAPLLGLFGTILGLIQTFNVLSAHGGPTEVTGGIADALIATAAGVLVAVVAVCFLNALNAMLTSITFQLDTIKLALLNRLHGNGIGPLPGDTADRTQPARAMRSHVPEIQGVDA